MAKNPQQRNPDYVVRPAALNVAYGSPNGYGSPPDRDETYRIPAEWIEVNASRYFFTNKQIIDGAVTEFSAPDLPRFCRCYGIYFLIANKEIIYVGLSTDIPGRLEQHAKNGVRFDSFSWFEAPELFLKRIEAYYIDRICPILNNDYPPVYGFGEIARKLEGPEDRTMTREPVVFIVRAPTK